jgi:hypothetical protein
MISLRFYVAPGDHLRVLRQVMVEFWQERETVLLDPRDTDKTAKQLADRRDSTISMFRAGPIELDFRRIELFS